YSQTLVLSLIPASRVGVALTYDFHRRFATDNHRFGGRINLKASERLLVSAFFRGGSVKVLPKWSADLGIAHKLSPGLTASTRYNLDTMTWPGKLHRAAISLGAQVHKSTFVEG